MNGAMAAPNFDSSVVVVESKVVVVTATATDVELGPATTPTVESEHALIINSDRAVVIVEMRLAVVTSATRTIPRAG